MICGRKVFLGGLMSLAGCFYLAPPPGMMPGPPPTPLGPYLTAPPTAVQATPTPEGRFLPPPPAPSLRFGLGAGMGFMLIEGYAGPGIELGTTLRFSEDFGVRLSYGRYAFEDPDPWYDDRFTVEPLLVAAVFSTPRAAGPAYRKTFAIGTGVFRVDYDDMSPYDLQTFFVAGGGEWLYGRGRLYTSADLYFVIPESGYYYSLSAAVAFRFGYETTF